MRQEMKTESSILILEQKPDWITVETLQQRILKSNCDFKTAALDLALEKALNIPKRKAKKEQLAEDIYRDSKREISNNLKPSSKKAKVLTEQQYLLEQSDATYYYETSSKAYTQIIHKALSLLTKKEKLAIHIKASDTYTLAEIEKLMGVSVRQYRNILKQAQNKLQSFPSFREAFFLAFLETDFKEFDEFMEINTRAITKF